jgi:Ribonuclease HepT-like
MPFDRAYAALVNIEYIDLAARFLEGFTYETFCDDLKTFYAVTRALEIISEASRRLPNEFEGPASGGAMAGDCRCRQLLSAQLRAGDRTSRLENSNDRTADHQSCSSSRTGPLSLSRDVSPFAYLLARGNSCPTCSRR